MPGLNYVLVAGVVTAAAAALPTRGAEAIGSTRFGQIHSLIKPKAAEEKWAQIPWLASLWQARQQAAKEGKPILLWEMDGHPLGCV